MIRNIIHIHLLARIRPHLELHRGKTVLPRASSYLQHSIVDYSTATPPTLSQEIDKWENKLDNATRNRLFEIKVEVKSLFEAGEKVCNPDRLTIKQWQHILALPSLSARKREYNYIGQKNYWKVKDKRKQEERTIHGSEIKEAVLKERSENKHIIYGLGQTALYSRIISKSMDAKRNLRLIRAKQFQEQKVIFDCSYDQYMSWKFIRYTARHLTQAYSDNRKNLQPFDLHICNSRSDSKTMIELDKNIPNLRDPNFTIEVHDECFTDLYPKENLIYLTPDSKNVLSEYDARDIYVIPAVVDKGFNGPITMTKAKKSQIRTAWFPINRYLPLGPGGKCLPLDIIIKILLDFKNKQKWEEALKQFPARRLARHRQVRQELASVPNKIGKVADISDGQSFGTNVKIPISRNPFGKIVSKSSDVEGDKLE